jgi:phytanoyl-CoA hydroxylase
MALGRIQQAVAPTLSRVSARAVSAVRPDPAPVLTPEQRRQWARDGFLFIPCFYSEAEVRGMAGLLDRLWSERRRADNPVVIDVFDGAEPARRYFRDVADDARDVVHKLNDLYLVAPEMLELSLGDRLTALLTELLEGEPCIINSLNLEYGSEQDYHFDTWYMPPPVEGRMAVSFIAFDAIDAENGPLQYFPGSHHLAPWRFSHGRLHAVEDELPACERHTHAWLAEEGSRPEQIRCRPGDLFLWHAQLFHGGAPIEDRGRTRRSLVTHYWRAEDITDGTVEPVGPGRHLLRRPHQPVAAG